MKEFKDKVVVITGAASGIGLGIAKHCILEGMKVVLADIDEATLMQTKHDLESTGTDVLAIITDVSKPEDVENLAHKTVETFGAVHLLFNNAGVSAGSWLWKSSVADWKWVFDVNLWGVIHGLRIFVPMMLAQDVECHIVNTSSMMGLASLPGGGIYAATKYAVVAISETLYHEFKLIKAKVQVSVLCPAGVNTRITESERNRPVSTPVSSPETGSGPNDNELAEKWWKQVWDEALEPNQVAETIFDAIKNERFYILTHPEYAETILKVHFEDILEGRNPTNPYSIPLF